MGHKNHKPEPESKHPPPPDLEAAISHADTGYKNAQDVIKFMDTKSGVIAGFAFVAIGIVLQAAKEFLEIPADLRSAVVEQFKTHSGWAYAIFVIALGSLIAGIGCIWCVVRCVTARHPPFESDLKQIFLFPFYAQDDGALNRAREYYAKVKTGLTLAEIAAEYEIQHLNVGAILYKKITWHRRAANVFLLQLALLTVAGALFLGCFFVFTGAPRPSAQPPAASAPTSSISNTASPPPPSHGASNPIPSSNP